MYSTSGKGYLEKVFIDCKSFIKVPVPADINDSVLNDYLNYLDSKGRPTVLLSNKTSQETVNKVIEYSKKNNHRVSVMTTDDILDPDNYLIIDWDNGTVIINMSS